MKSVEITSPSGLLSATFFGSDSPRKVLIIASATGVRQEFYRKFAAYIAAQNIAVLTFDYCGIGQSLTTPIKSLSNNAADWGQHDLEAVLQYSISNFPNATKVLLGHSIGGQLVGLAPSSPHMDQIILVAAQSGYWKYWKGSGKLKMWFNWHVLFPTLLNLFGYLPSKKLSGMENLPKNVANQWRTWGKHPDYLLSDRSIADTSFEKISMPVSAFSVEDDAFAPATAVQWLTDKFTNAKVTSVHWSLDDLKAKKVGHFGFFKERNQAIIWKRLLEEML